MPREIEIKASQFLEWIDGQNLRTAKGERFEWYEHEFMIDPLLDFHPDQGLNKSAQVGFSESMILKAIFLAKELGLNVLYTLPTAEDMGNFVKEKFDPIVEANQHAFGGISGNTSIKDIPYISGSGKDKKTFKRFIHLRSAFNSEAASNKAQTKAGVSFTTDVNIHDEASKSDQFVLDQMRSRYENSKFAWRWLFDNPTIPNNGADKVFQVSDQRHWFVTCSRCGYKQYLDWYRLDEHAFESGTRHCWIDVENQCFRCGKCKGVLRDEDRRKGEWVAKRKHITDYRGYWINQLMYIHHSAKSLIKKQADYTPANFANMVLGKPYIGSDVNITPEQILENYQSRPIKGYGLVTIGVDQGNEKQYVVGDEHGIFKMGRTNSWQDIEFLFLKYKNAYMVIDAGPETGPVKELCEKYPGRIWRARYKPEADQSELARFSPKTDRTLVLIRREEMFDQIAYDFSARRVPINVNINELRDYINDFKNLLRIVEKDARGNDRAKWDQTSGPVDFAHATLYQRVARIKARRGSAEMLSNDMPDPIQAQPLPKTTAELIGEYTNVD